LFNLLTVVVNPKRLPGLDWPENGGSAQGERPPARFRHGGYP